MTGEQSVPKQIRDAIEVSEYPELTVREVTERTDLSEQQVYSAAGSMARLELDQRVGVVRLGEDDGGEFVDDRERELVTDGGVDLSETQAPYGKKECPCCGSHVYSGKWNGTPVYKCSSPPSSCEWNRRWGEEHDKRPRMPLGKTVAQVRRVNAEFRGETDGE